jgi:NAD-dependent SIR2 family protein deacetylase
MKYLYKTIVEEGDVPICPYCPNPNNPSSSKSNNNTKKGSKRRPGYIKPDIVFFGENLPAKFHAMLSKDIYEADCCLVLGTSLQVAPVSEIPNMIRKPGCKRILLNREYVGNFRSSTNDLYYENDCDDTVLQLADLLGWKEELLNDHEIAIAAIRDKK